MGLFCANTTYLEAVDLDLRLRSHESRVERLAQQRIDRKSRNLKHPVEDFLWEYYSFRPSQLLRWSPGLRFSLDLQSVDRLSDSFSFFFEADRFYLSVSDFPPQRLEGLEWTIEVLKSISHRLPHFGCYGLHEWAMVYRSHEVRHGQLPLRLSPEETDLVVESHPIRCSHFDAFRFFTDQARPLNAECLQAENRLTHDQPGCLHVGMDLYKWSYKFYPWVDSDLIGRCFDLAFQIRQVDMQASPYDVSSLGYEPICIETPEGKLQYQSLQRQFMELAEPLRNELLESLILLKEHVS